MESRKACAHIPLANSKHKRFKRKSEIDFQITSIRKKLSFNTHLFSQTAGLNT